jgi:hypothetical protein
MSLYTILRHGEGGRRKSASAVDLITPPGGGRRRRSLEPTYGCTAKRRTSYNLDSIPDCLPPDPSRYVPEPLSRDNSSAPVHVPHSESVWHETEQPVWRDVRAQFDFALRCEKKDTIHARQTFLALWTLHVIAGRAPLCI